jgi:hypothetical protein
VSPAPPPPLGRGSTKSVLFAQIVGVSAELLITGERALKTRRVRPVDSDPDQLQVAAALEP